MSPLATAYSRLLISRPVRAARLHGSSKSTQPEQIPAFLALMLYTGTLQIPFDPSRRNLRLCTPCQGNLQLRHLAYSDLSKRGNGEVRSRHKAWYITPAGANIVQLIQSRIYSRKASKPALYLHYIQKSLRFSNKTAKYVLLNRASSSFLMSP